MSELPYEMNPVTPSERGALPVQVHESVELDCSADELFDCFEDAGSWKRFLDLGVTWHDEPPFKEGVSRTIVAPVMTALERFTVYERGSRMAFYFERSDTRMVEAFAEDWVVEPLSADRCRLTWSVGIRMRPWFGLLGPLAGFGMGRMGRDAFGKLKTVVGDYRR